MYHKYGILYLLHLLYSHPSPPPTTDTPHWLPPTMVGGCSGGWHLWWLVAMGVRGWQLWWCWLAVVGVGVAVLVGYNIICGHWVLIDSVPGLTYQPPSKGKKVDLKWLKMDFKGMLFLWILTLSWTTHPLKYGYIHIFLFLIFRVWNFLSWNINFWKKRFCLVFIS